MGPSSKMAFTGDALKSVHGMAGCQSLLQSVLFYLFARGHRELNGAQEGLKRFRTTTRGSKLGVKNLSFDRCNELIDGTRRIDRYPIDG